MNKCEHNATLGQVYYLWIKGKRILEIHYDICAGSFSGRSSCTKLRSIKRITLFDRLNFSYDEFLGFSFYYG